MFALQPAAQTMPITKKSLWTGRILSAIPVLMVLFGSILKLMKTPAMVQGMGEYGYSEGLIIPIGIIELVCCIVYIIPRTATLGAILLTGLLGGAITTSVRLGRPGWVFPLVLGVLVWAGLYLRDERLRALIPLQGEPKAESRG